MRTTMTITTNFAAAHRLPDHEGKCQRLHGHTYGLEVTVEGAPQQSGVPWAVQQPELDPAFSRIQGSAERRQPSFL